MLWAKYDSLASKLDDDMIQQLNVNLDVLLIFAGLFSAVNTAFIVVALTALSPGPADQTNHLIRLLLTNGTNSALTSDELAPRAFSPSTAAIRQNCFFFASLGCSLLAAAGAVLAKQWLQYYQRTGNTGPVREKAMNRTEKYLGAETWGLKRVVELLLAVLQLSLAFFFAALVDYLWTINPSVAIVISAFTALGGLAFGFTVVVGAIYEYCPFQTSFTRSLRGLYRRGQNLPNDAKEIFDHHRTPQTWFSQTISRAHYLIRELRTTAEGWPDTALEYIRRRKGKVVYDVIPSAILIVYKPIYVTFTIILDWIEARRQRIPSQSFEALKNAHDQWIYTRSAIWMVETAPDEENILVIAENIPLISNLQSLLLIPPSNAFTLLLLSFRSSILAIYRDRAAVAHAITMAKAVAHIVLADPVHTAVPVCKLFVSMGSLDWLAELCGKEMEESEELMVLLMSMSSVFHRTELIGTSEKLDSVERALRKGLQQSNRKGAAATTQLHHLILMAPSSAASWVDRQRQISDIDRTLHLEGVKVDSAFVSCASLALASTLRALPGLHTQHQPIESQISAWDAHAENSLPNNLLDVLDTFSRYFVQARHSSPPLEIYTSLLHCQRKLLIHAKALSLSTDLRSLNSQPLEATVFQRMHSALNINIREVLTMNPVALNPRITPFELRTCLDTLVDSLRDLLLTPGVRWSKVNTSDLEITARWARRLGSKEDKLSEAILYRYFLEIQDGLHLVDSPNKGQAVDSLDKRRMRLSRDSNVGIVLTSALRLYLWLYPKVASERRWPDFSHYLLFLATGQLETGDRAFEIDWIPTAIEDRRQDRRQIPKISDGLDPRRHRPAVVASRNNTLAREVEETIAGTLQEWDPTAPYDMMGSGALWLAESLRFRHQMPWVMQIDEQRVIRMFIGIMRQAREGGKDSRFQEGMWTSVDVQSAGALFLRTWEAKTASSDEPAATPTSAASLHTLGWLSSATIEAFTQWLQTYEAQGSISIEDKGDDLIVMQTAAIPILIAQFIERACIENAEAVSKYKLDAAGDEFIHGPTSPLTRMMMDPWKDRKAGQWTPAIESTKRASTRQASFLGQRRPPPIDVPPDEHRHSRFFDATRISRITESPKSAEFEAEGAEL
ncbi:hypothetical protein FRB97_008824 [Tulasnella sp. 331]|nr:hypothetical protein FRB97_008824 [Tulasnella sp. 331]